MRRRCRRRRRDHGCDLGDVVGQPRRPRSHPCGGRPCRRGAEQPWVRVPLADRRDLRGVGARQARRRRRPWCRAQLLGDGLAVSTSFPSFCCCAHRTSSSPFLRRNSRVRVRWVRHSSCSQRWPLKNSHRPKRATWRASDHCSPMPSASPSSEVSSSASPVTSNAASRGAAHISRLGPAPPERWIGLAGLVDQGPHADLVGGRSVVVLPACPRSGCIVLGRLARELHRRRGTRPPRRRWRDRTPSRAGSRQPSRDRRWRCVRRRP